ncbi:MAG: lysozyme [Alphaproteobacteria bacterium]
MNDKQKAILERIKKFKNKVLVGTLLSSALVAGKAQAAEVDTSSDTANDIKHKKEVKAHLKSENDDKAFRMDTLDVQKRDTLSVREYNEQSIKKADAAVKVLIAMTEDFRDETYLCAAKVRTFGYGITNIGRPLRKSDSISKFTEITDDMDEDQRRDAILSKGMEYVSEYLAEHVYPVILDNVTQKLEPNQMAAISSLIYNTGKGNFLGYTNKKNGKVIPPSPVFIAINKGIKGEELGKAFMKHIYAGGKPNRGLAARRFFEFTMSERPEFMSTFPDLKVGACYLTNINDYFKEDVSTRERFVLATRRGRLTPKTDDKTIQGFIQDIKSAKPEMREVFHILPQDTINAFNRTYIRDITNLNLIDSKPQQIPVVPPKAVKKIVQLNVKTIGK